VKSRSRKLKRKIRACAGVTGAGGLVAASSLGLVSKAYGTAVRTQHNDTIPHGTSLSYDIDDNGIPDITFNILSFDGVKMEAETTCLISSCVFHSCLWCGDVIKTPSTPLVEVHAQGESIPPSVGTCAPMDQCEEPTVQDGVIHSPVLGGGFLNPTSPRYAGFSFVGSDPVTHLLQIQTGWAELEITEVYPGIYDLEVIAIGYETDRNTTIQAGYPLTPTAVENEIPPAVVELFGIAPNPFGARTRIGFDLPEAGAATIRIFDASGRLVREFAHAGARGTNSVYWDGLDGDGVRVSSGVYFCRLEALGTARTGKMVILR